MLRFAGITPSRRLFCLGLTAAATCVMPASAQMFGGRPIKLVVPVPPGSITDSTARFYADRLQAILARPVIVENRPGGNHFIAANAVLGAAPDGDTVLIGTTSTLATNVALFKNLPYDPVADFTPLTLLSRLPSVMIFPPNKYNTVADLIAAAKKAPGSLNYASGATSYQLMSELFNEMANIQTTNIPYKGAADALIAVLSGQVDFSILDASTAMGNVTSGKVRGGMVASQHRLEALPDVPTSAEAGLPNFLCATWVAAAVSAKTPKETADRLASALTAIAEEPATKSFLARQGAEISSAGPEALRALQRDEVNLWRRVATTAKIEAQ